jgi:hypothetical protein
MIDNNNNYNPMPPPPDMNWRNNGLSSWDELGGGSTYGVITASQSTMNDWSRTQQQHQELYFESQMQPQHYHEQQLQSQRYQQLNVLVQQQQQHHHQLNLPPIPPPLPPPPPPPLPPTQEDEGGDGINKKSMVSSSRERLGDKAISTPISREKCTNQVPITSKSKPLVVTSSTKTDPSDTAIDAFNALSDLQNRWTNPAVTVGEKRKVTNETNNTIYDTTTSSQKSKKKRRKRGKKKNNSDDGAAIDSNNDAEEEKWIDVEDDSLAKYQPSTLSSACAIRSVIDFPPLIKSDDDNDPALATSLDRLSTSELTSYAAVLQGALDRSNDVALNASSIPLHGVGMTTTHTSENQATRLIVSNTIEVIDLCNDRKEDQQVDGEATEISNSTMLLPIDPTPRIMTDAVSSVRADDGGGEKEKRALKLAELKAKAKLAKAKLRLAEQKKDRVRALTPIPSSISPLPKKLDDITALRNINSLVINDVSITGPTNEVRFVDSEFRSQYNNKQSKVRAPILPLTTSRYGKSMSRRTAVQDSTSTSNTQPTTLLTNDDKQQMKTKSLTQQIQQAKLQLEIKKKVKEKRELVKKMKLHSDSKTDSASTKPPPEETDGIDSSNQLVYNTEAISQLPLMNETMDEMNVVNNNRIEDSMKVCSEESAALDVAESRAKLELLRRRQKKLKQENEIANLKNMIQRQQELLGQVNRELTDNTAQLQSCESRIKLKQALLDTSEKNLDEMNNRKKIIEGMVLRATEQVMAARKALSDRQQLG